MTPGGPGVPDRPAAYEPRTEPTGVLLRRRERPFICGRRSSSRRISRACCRVGLWVGGVGDVDVDDLESEVANTGQEAVQGRVVHEHAGEDGLVVHLDVVERSRHGGADRSLEPDEYVFHDRPSGVRLDVSGPPYDGVTGSHTTAMLDECTGCVIAPME